MTAVISVEMIGPGMDEGLASLEHVQAERRAVRGLPAGPAGRDSLAHGG